jgi:hypothetical protein
MAIALIFLFFTFFKGATNIINAFLVPLTLFLATIHTKKRDMIAVYIVLILFCLLLFPLQMVFVVFYCAIAYMLVILTVRKVRLILAVLILTIVVGCSFWLAILLTDLLLHTNMNAIMMDLLHGNVWAYILLIFFEATLVAAGQIIISRSIYNRLPKSNV